jgi:hypothetical protein
MITVQPAGRRVRGSRRNARRVPVSSARRCRHCGRPSAQRVRVSKTFRKARMLLEERWRALREEIRRAERARRRLPRADRALDPQRPYTRPPDLDRSTGPVTRATRAGQPIHDSHARRPRICAVTPHSLRRRGRRAWSPRGRSGADLVERKLRLFAQRAETEGDCLAGRPLLAEGDDGARLARRCRWRLVIRSGRVWPKDRARKLESHFAAGGAATRHGLDNGVKRE